MVIHQCPLPRRDTRFTCGAMVRGTAVWFSVERVWEAPIGQGTALNRSNRRWCAIANPTGECELLPGNDVATVGQKF